MECNLCCCVHCQQFSILSFNTSSSSTLLKNCDKRSQFSLIFTLSSTFAVKQKTMIVPSLQTHTDTSQCKFSPGTAMHFSHVFVNLILHSLCCSLFQSDSTAFEFPTFLLLLSCRGASFLLAVLWFASEEETVRSTQFLVKAFSWLISLVSIVGLM